MVLGRVRISPNNKDYNSTVNLYFDKDAGRLIDARLVFDKAGMRFRNATIDDGKSYKANRSGGVNFVVSARFPDVDGLIGEYEIEESECGMWYIMYKV